MTSGEYIHGTDPEEQARLAMLNALLNRSSLRAIRLEGGERVLDVGSGLGQLTRAIARAVGRSGSVVAVERDPNQLAEAKRDRGGEEEDRIEFRQGDAAALPLEDHEWGTFDVVHTRFLLEHVRDPLSVVKSMVRAVRPGGRIILEDDDHEGLRFWPPAPCLEKLWIEYARSYELIGNDPWIGRKLVSLLHEAGATPTRNNKLFFGSCRGDARFDSFLSNLLGVIETARERMLTADLVTPGDWDAGIAEAREWGARPDAAIWYHTCWAEGRKPGDQEIAETTEIAPEERQISPLEFLLESSRDLNSSLDLTEVFKKIADRIQEFVDHHLLCVMLWNEKTQLLEHSYSVRYGEHIEQKGGFRLGEGISGSVAQDRAPIRAPDVSKDPRYVRFRHAEVEIRSELAIPLLVQDRLVGVIDIESTELDAFSEEHEQLLTALASQIAVALENARLYEEVRGNEQRMEEDLALARELQKGLLPAAPPMVNGLGIGAAYAPAKELSGDFYEMYAIDAGRVAIAVGDVAGKSTPAALYGALAVGGLREFASKHALDPAEMLGRVDGQLRRFRDQGRFLAMVYAVFDAEARTVKLSGAGFPPPLLVREGEVEEVVLTGVPLGTLLPHDRYGVEMLDLRPGELVVFTSDGFEDCENVQGEPFGREGLVRALEGVHGSAQAAAEALLEATDEWAGSAEIRDDRTVVVVRIEDE